MRYYDIPDSVVFDCLRYNDIYNSVATDCIRYNTHFDSVASDEDSLAVSVRNLRS